MSAGNDLSVRNGFIVSRMWRPSSSASPCPSTIRFFTRTKPRSVSSVKRLLTKTTSGFSIATYPFPPWTCILAFEIIVGFNFTFYKAFVNVSWHKGFNSVYRQGNHSCLFSRTPKKPLEKRANFGPLGSKTKWF